MKKKVFLALVVLVLLGLALPVYNLIEPLPLSRLTEVKIGRAHV